MVVEKGPTERSADRLGLCRHHSHHSHHWHHLHHRWHVHVRRLCFTNAPKHLPPVCHCKRFYSDPSPPHGRDDQGHRRRSLRCTEVGRLGASNHLQWPAICSASCRERIRARARPREARLAGSAVGPSRRLRDHEGTLITILSAIVAISRTPTIVSFLSLSYIVQASASRL
jgi:hypothetical protein